MARNTGTPTREQLHLLHQQQQFSHHMGSPSGSHHLSSHPMSSPAVPSQHGLNARREMTDGRQQQHHPLGRPSPIERR